MGVVLRRSATELPCSNAARICCFTARWSSEVIVIDIICLLSSARHREKPCPQCNRRAYRCLLTHFCPWPNTLTGDVIVVWRLDRLGRSLKQLIETVTMLGEQGIELRSLKENIDT